MFFVVISDKTVLVDKYRKLFLKVNNINVVTNFSYLFTTSFPVFMYSPHLIMYVYMPAARS